MTERAVVAGRHGGASPYDYDLATCDTGDAFRRLASPRRAARRAADNAVTPIDL